MQINTVQKVLLILLKSKFLNDFKDYFLLPDIFSIFFMLQLFMIHLFPILLTVFSSFLLRLQSLDIVFNFLCSSYTLFLYSTAIYLFKVNIRAKCETCSKLTKDMQERHNSSFPCVFIVKFEPISLLVIIFLLLRATRKKLFCLD